MKLSGNKIALTILSFMISFTIVSPTLLDYVEEVVQDFFESDSPWGCLLTVTSSTKRCASL
jgi:hypothetical protein